MFIQVILLYLLTTTSADVHDTLTYHYDYDVVVYDATSGGVTAAVAAAQNGHHTALLCASFPACFVEGGQRVGGMSSGGLGQTDLGPTWPYIGGLAREFYQRNRAHYGNRSKSGSRGSHATTEENGIPCRLPSQKGCNNIAFNLEPHVARSVFEEMLKESHVDVFYGAQALSIHKNINNTKVIETLTIHGNVSFSAHIFIDASYEGDLMKVANVSSVVGREARSQYNESLAGFRTNATENQFSLSVDPFDTTTGQPLPLTALPPDLSLHREVEGMADNRVQAYNFRLCVTQVQSNSVPFPKPAKYDRTRFELFRRYAVKCAHLNSSHSKLCELDFPSCNTQRVPNLKYDMNNCGGISSDFIGGSLQYPDATYNDRKEIWLQHLQYQQVRVCCFYYYTTSFF